MNDTNNSQGGSNFGGNNTGGNNFNNNNNTPRPNPVPQAPSNIPTGNNGGNLTPQFSGMPSAPGVNNVSRPLQPQSQPQQPRPTPPPAPVPAPVQPAQPFQQPPRPAVAPAPTFVPPPPRPQVTPAPTPVFQSNPNVNFTPRPTPPPVVTKSGSKGLGVTLIVLLILVLLGVGVWAFKPFMYMPTDDNIENKVANPVNKPVGNSAFPSGVVTSNPTPVVPGPSSANTYSQTDQQKIEEYIRQNINRLAKTTGYAVDDVTFDGPGRAMVSYSRGGISKSAVVNAYVDSAGVVRVTSFMVLTK